MNKYEEWKSWQLYWQLDYIMNLVLFPFKLVIILISVVFTVIGITISLILVPIKGVYRLKK